MYHDSNSYSEQINKSKLDLQKIITNNDKSLSPYHRYSNSFNTTTSYSNNSFSNGNLSHGNSNKHHSTPISKFSRTKINDFDSSEIHSSNNNSTTTNNNNNNNNNNTTTNTNANNGGNITTTNNTNSNNSNRNSLQLLRDISFKISKSPTVLSSKLFDSSASFIRSEPVSLNNISQYANSNPSLNQTLTASASAISTTTTTSNSLVDIFLVTKPKKVGLNILNQHIEYAVIARKYGVS